MKAFAIALLIAAVPLGLAPLATLGLSPSTAEAKAKRKPAKRAVKSKSVRTLAGSSSRGFSSCKAARAAGAAPFRRGTAAYDANARLDRDEDGVACE